MLCIAVAYWTVTDDQLINACLGDGYQVSRLFYNLWLSNIPSVDSVFYPGLVS